MSIETLKARLLEINDQVQAIQSGADALGRDLSTAEDEKMTALLAEFEKKTADVERREKMEANAAKLSASAGRKVTAANVVVVSNDDPNKGGFSSMGEFAAIVRAAAHKQNPVWDDRIKNAPTTTVSEGVGAEGGILVPAEFSDKMLEKVFAEDSLLSLTDQMQTSRNSVTFPKDETTPWQTTGGIQAYWGSEGSQLDQSNIDLQTESMRLNKLTALVPVTEEMLEDTTFLSSYIGKKAPEKMDARINTAIISGTGVGQFKGILNADSLVTVAKESGQAADTIVHENIVNMWSRMYAPSTRNAVWLVNQDILPQLNLMTLAGTNSSTPSYLPPGGLSVAPYGTIMGRPIMPVQPCKTLGDKGDIILADMKQYMSLTKGGIKADVSMHLWFDYDVQAFRFIFRLTGQPWWSSAITPENGSNTLSPFVTLAERA